MTENQLRYLAHQENVRHNLATEGHNVNVLAETARSNLAKEGETHRANVAHETETNRSNVRKETEQKRHNLVTEAMTGFKEGRSLVTELIDAFVPG